MQKGFISQPIIFVLLGILVILLIAGGVYYFISSSKLKPPSSQAPQACTNEAMVCPDGSAVGRVGPNCEFAPCPAGKTTDKIITPSNPPDSSNPSTTQDYRLGGSFTEKATEKEIGSISSRFGSDVSSVSLLESFPLQFQITSPSQTSCEKVRKALAGLKFIQSVGDCQKVESGNSDPNQSVISN
ncbi:MAG: hypothetical protein ACD_38C00161G0009 [uncultured bacterium]|uniref:Uncharacterized protein n=1 Tax=Candidatus Daviesbacteria bacterium GW2011_GWC2_40_12 TaxID=1618431 RepID=A0A0G0QPR9_9BACT|nr:MAG: hypothetical protein ACD_38C00161G0009 [uncultured bacterium]KKQ84707.1 MAG: hypothetical protein UT04_C0012G0012 [Candidatus Daviesbacteria bacterium GW2011_GWF2_38_7]KKR17024.1 MAG: hypothetical protein UT45_C0003G0054 [Candidatus Daviesbacteria bacterium GW2011_GWA2_39_33]KKR22693.1 MAG: hypothetical protein UT54_C0063G0005 [Candidatus Daviesbacteria bacterium GW2011_GWB1_39_5]KKR42088.1 MAG: hypothetical protein UT77_C0004G0072 [Candidatus Daviesbacteria bacterium GW2011_GWC2_40_12]